MNWKSTPARVLALFALLTWLFCRSMGTAGIEYVTAQRDVARVSLAEAQLRADILEMRASMLRDDDVPDHDVVALETAAHELKRHARVRRRDAPALDRLIATVGQESAALERFKTCNAIFQNSKSYFDELGDELAVGGRDLPMVTAVAALGNAVLHFENEPVGAAQARLRDVLRAAERLPVDDISPNRRDAFRLLLAHANILVQVVPEVDGEIRTLFDISTYDDRQLIRRSQDARRLAEENQAGWFRGALYAVAVILAVRLAKVAIAWRAGLSLLRERADAERVVIDVSARLLAAPLDDFASAIRDALERLASGFGADRAYLLILEPADLLGWSRPGLSAVDGWPQALVGPVLAAAARRGDLIEASPVRRAEPGPLRLALDASGLAGWCGTVLRRSDKQPAAILGFDLAAPAAPWPRGGAGMVRLAGEVLQSALLRRRAALDRRELEERLGRARRLEAVGAFASGIAHNVNNVVGAVMGHAEMAADAAGSGGDPAHHIREISRAGERAQELVAAILRFATRTSTRKQPVDIEALVAETVAMLRVQLDPSIALHADVRGSHRVRGDAAGLQQILLNLVRNAAQAIERNGRIVVVAQAERIAREHALSHDVQLPGHYVRIEVSDTGPGMDPSILGRIFEPFFTSRPGGTGLGLATVREIVHDHAGFLDVGNSAGGGCVFRVWLPIDEAAAPSPTPRRGGEPVLVVCGRREQLGLDEDMLAALGYEPIGVTGPEAAARAIARVAVDAIILDVDGAAPLDAVRRLQAAGARAPVVLVTNRDDPSDIADLAAHDVVAVLRRPLRSAAVADALSSCVASARPVLEMRVPT